MDNADDIVSFCQRKSSFESGFQYQQTADLDGGNSNSEGPPRIQKPTRTVQLPDNPLLRVLKYCDFLFIFLLWIFSCQIWTRIQEAFNSSVKRDEDISDFERDFHKSLGITSTFANFTNICRIWTCAERLGVRCTTSKRREATPANGSYSFLRG